jgi:dihydrofolate reductase
VTKSVYYCATSLDGYIADPDDRIDWLTGYEGRYDGPDAEPIAGSYDRFYDGVGALVSGATTYEWVLDHTDGGREWPYAGKPCWVLSSRDLPTPEDPAADVRIVAAEVAELHPEMIAAAGERDLWVVGGGNIASQFAAAGLLDEVRLTVVPVVIGAGKPLFEGPLRGGPLRLTGARPFDSGMVDLRYEVERG